MDEIVEKFVDKSQSSLIKILYCLEHLLWCVILSYLESQILSAAFNQALIQIDQLYGLI